MRRCSSMVKITICCVRPGVLLVRARDFCSVCALMALDFPALERPAKATSQPWSAGSWCRLCALIRYSAWRYGLGRVEGGRAWGRRGDGLPVFEAGVFTGFIFARAGLERDGFNRDNTGNSFQS